MKRIKMILKKLIYPPGWVVCVFSSVVFAILIFIFVMEQKESWAAYLIYPMAAYSLIVVLAALSRLVQRLKYCKKIFLENSKLAKKASSTAFGSKYLNDRAFRGSISIYQGLIANFLYMLFRFITGIKYASAWFISIAVYYMLLGFLRTYLIQCYRNPVRNNEENRLVFEYRCYCKTAWLLFLLNIPMGGMILLMIKTDSGYSYPGYVIYISALYTFYIFIVSITNMIKYRKLGSPILSAAKVLNFIAAMMSVLGLQTAMISRFSYEGDSYRRLMNTITGSSVYVITIGIAVYVLIFSAKKKKQIEKGVPCDEQIPKQIL